MAVEPSPTQGWRLVDAGNPRTPPDRWHADRDCPVLDGHAVKRAGDDRVDREPCLWCASDQAAALVSCRHPHSKGVYHTDRCQIVDHIERLRPLPPANARERGWRECQYCSVGAHYNRDVGTESPRGGETVVGALLPDHIMHDCSEGAADGD